MKDSPNVNLMSALEVAQYIVQAELNRLSPVAAQLSEEQIRVTLTKLVPEHEIQWAAKLIAILQGLNERTKLQAFGSALSANQMLAVLHYYAQSEHLHRDKLQYILITLPQPAFEQLLLIAEKEALQVLKNMGGTESLQHHLTLLVHQLAQGLEGGMKDLQWLKREIETYDVKSLRNEDLDQFISHLASASNYLEYHLSLINLALELAWNTTRQDFLEHLMILKDDCIKLIRQVVGYASDGDQLDSGLYLILQKRLCTIFGEENGFGGLEDSAPSLEALAALSLWVVEDYWEIGLLPGITTREQLNLGPDSSETEQTHYNTQLIAHAQSNLKAAGLATVENLKRCQIFSKDLLQRYLDYNKSWLKPFK